MDILPFNKYQISGILTNNQCMLYIKFTKNVLIRCLLSYSFCYSPWLIQLPQFCNLMISVNQNTFVFHKLLCLFSLSNAQKMISYLLRLILACLDFSIHQRENCIQNIRPITSLETVKVNNLRFVSLISCQDPSFSFNYFRKFESWREK